MMRQCPGQGMVFFKTRSKHKTWKSPQTPPPSGPRGEPTRPPTRGGGEGNVSLLLGTPPKKKKRRDWSLPCLWISCLQKLCHRSSKVILAPTRHSPRCQEEKSLTNLKKMGLYRRRIKSRGREGKWWGCRKRDQNTQARKRKCHEVQFFKKTTAGRYWWW